MTLLVLQSESEAVRDAGLRGLSAVVRVLRDVDPEMRQLLTRRVWVARCDPSPENRQLALDLWTAAGLVSTASLAPALMPDVTHPVAAVREAASEALALLLADQATSMTGQVGWVVVGPEIGYFLDAIASQEPALSLTQSLTHSVANTEF